MQPHESADQAQQCRTRRHDLAPTYQPLRSCLRWLAKEDAEGGEAPLAERVACKALRVSGIDDGVKNSNIEPACARDDYEDGEDGYETWSLLRLRLQQTRLL